MSCLKSTLSAEKVSGYFTDITWYRFDMDLWSYYIYLNEKVSTKNVEIDLTKVEYGKALLFKNNKNIEYLPVKVAEILPKIIVYEAINCSLKEIRYENFEDLNELQQVSVQYGQISHVPKDTFKDLSKLKFLYLNDNQLQFIDERVFQNLGRLIILIVDDNQISSITRGTLENLTELKNVSFTGNKLQALDDGHFKNNKKLEYIWFDNNNIQVLKPTMFDNMKNVVYIDFSDNMCIDEIYRVDSDDCLTKRTEFENLKEIIENDCEF